MYNSDKNSSIWHHPCSVYAVVMLLCSLSFMFFACQEKEMPETTDEFPVVWDGDKIVVNFTVSENGMGENEVLTRKASANPLSSSFEEKNGGFKETAVVPITHNISMYATLIEEDKPVKLRNFVGLTSNSHVCVVAYVIMGDTIYDGSADYTTSDGHLLNSVSPLSVAPGLTYKFVAYSYDRTFPITYSDPTTEIPPLTPIIWGDTIATVTPNNFNLHITMHHLTSMVTLVVNSQPTGLLINEIDDIEVARIHASLPKLNVKDGELFPVNTGYGFGSFSWPVSSPSVIKTSELLYPFPASGETTTSLEIDSLWINGTRYTGPETSTTTTEPFKVVFSKPLEVGKAYTLQVYLHYALGGSADRITLYKNGATKLAITNDPNDPGLYFKFGSVVGVDQPQSTFVLSDIHFNPLSNPNDITQFGTNANQNTLPSIPAYEVTDLVNNISTNAYHNLQNVLAGKGDPCRLIGMDVSVIRGFTDNEQLYNLEAQLKADGIGGWRLPTMMENIRFSGQTGPNGYDLHWWDTMLPYISPFGTPPVKGGEFPTRNSNNGSPDGTKFLPYLGYITYDGIYNSWDSYYLSSDPGLSNVSSDIPHGRVLYFIPSLVDPTRKSNEFQGYSVRCVRDESPIRLDVEEWDNNGTPGGIPLNPINDIIIP